MIAFSKTDTLLPYVHLGNDMQLESQSTWRIIPGYR